LRNAVFASDVLVIPANCSRVDFEVTRLFFDTLKECDLDDKEIFICVNSYNAKYGLPGILDLYKGEFENFLLPFTIPYIQSLKKLTDNVDYPLNADVKKWLSFYVDYITNAQGGEANNV
jgi:cellulose biosynthesis protein BcsQ